MTLDRIVLCTRNPGKVTELRAFLNEEVEVLSLDDVGIVEELPEEGDTFRENALQKARHVAQKCGLPCLADDSGLEVVALNGAPGVRSARYAGWAGDQAANMDKLLVAMHGISDRRARFVAVIALVEGDAAHVFEGTVEGSITMELRGGAGFGYDPVFVPAGDTRTYAEMTTSDKQRTSHRAKAMEQVVAWLRSR